MADEAFNPDTGIPFYDINALNAPTLSGFSPWSSWLDLDTPTVPWSPAAPAPEPDASTNTSVNDPSTNPS